MKTILYNPIFINPQAYYVFPRLTRYLQPDNESTAEPANYIGTIEVKVIAYGDTTLKRTYTNTDSIDLSEFKNTWIRISLFTKVGSCVLGEWKIGNMESDLPYIDPEVLASLKAVVIVGNKTNNDSDRAIVKNLVDPDNPFVISNAAYDKMSSYGGYEFAKFDNTLDWYNTEGNDSVEVVSRNGHSITLKRLTGPNFWYFQNSTFRGLISNVIPFKVNSNKNITVIWDVHGLSISEGKDKSVRIQELVLNPNEDNYTNLKTLNEEELAQIDISTNSLYYLLWFDLSTLAVDEEVTIEMLPLFEGAFVTDGIDDLITSTKTVQEMLGGSNEITVVSMIHQVKNSSNNVSFTNYIRGSANGYFRNIVNNYDKTGIYGYTSSDLMGLSVVNNILGDKNDYTSNGDNRDSIINGNFSVQGYSYNDGNNTGDFSSVAWYWTIIANKVLTTDQINQVIAYFNLDRTLKSDIYCNIAKQGITNENHAEFGDKLIDFSGNGRDIQLNNIAWDGDSGIGKYNYPNWKVTATIANTYSTIVNYPTVNGTYSINVNGVSELMQSIGLHLEIKYTTSTGIIYKDIKQDGVYSYILPDGATDLTLRFGGIPGIVNEPCNITITQIPSHAGALCLDGVSDFGKATGMPVYKDYTFIIDYERISYASSERQVAGVVSKSHVANQGAFILMTANTTVEPGKQAYSFGGVTSFNRDDFTRALVYQSKYKCGDVDLTVGEGVDSNTLWLGTFRDNDQRFFNGAIYSLMSFPYSMSEFLIERQLKKHKLGTLYPDIVEWRPIIKSNVEYASISYLLRIPGQGTVTPVIGQYYPILSTDTSLVVYVATNGVDEVANLTINGQEPTSSSIHVDGRFKFEFPFNNSPQKINITIDEYIRYEDIDFTNCYPGVPRIYVNDKSVTWGDKLKVGDEFTFYGNVNILPEMYNVLVKALYNGEEMVYGSIGTISKSMVFTSFKTYIFDDNEPKCILSPRLLSIPNSSYKILGYIPDISGHGNNGVIHNSAYTEGSGVNEDGSYQFDGVDDFVTIPTVTGGKQVLMKVNWQSDVGAVTLYDQRLNISDYEFAIYNGTRDLDDNPVMAYQGRNNGQTYIDGILNSNIMASELKAITHNITITNELSLGINNTYPVIGSTKSNTHFAQMSLYDFMLFDEISTDEEILTLNEYVGIEGNTDDLFN